MPGTMVASAVASQPLEPTELPHQRPSSSASCASSSSASLKQQQVCELPRLLPSCPPIFNHCMFAVCITVEVTPPHLIPSTTCIDLFFYSTCHEFQRALPSTLLSTPSSLPPSLPLCLPPSLPPSLPQGPSEDGEGEIIIAHIHDPTSENDLLVKKFLKGKLLGKGGFAKCYWATCLETQAHYALKIVVKASLHKSKARHRVSRREKGCI